MIADLNISGDDLLAKAARGGDRGAFGELVSRHHAKIRGLLGYLTRDMALADDLAQQAFLRAWEKLSSFRGETSARFAAWLSRIAYREFLQHLRGSRTESQLVSSISVEELAISQERIELGSKDESLSYENTLVAEQPLSAMVELLKPCSRVQSEVLYMNYVLELTHEEIALITENPLGTVKSHISRGKAAIRTALETESAELKTGAPSVERI